MKVSTIARVTRSWGASVVFYARTGFSVSELDRGRPGRRRGDHGATAVECALMAGLIAVVIVVSVTLFGLNVSRLYDVPTSVFQP